MAELEFVSDIILTFPGHEAAWYHRYVYVTKIVHYRMAPQLSVQYKILSVQCIVKCSLEQ